MPTQELEKQICNWVEPRKEVGLTYRKCSLVDTTDPPEKSAGSKFYDEQSVWDLAHAFRKKAAEPQVFRKWTEEDLRIFAEEDELDPERAQRLATFLQTE